jgi:dTDP-4-amino-4,6-dideoxy-D-galactose acyltransferase
MSAAPPAAPCTVLEWDSEFFGVSIARVPDERPDAAALADAAAWADAQAVDCLYLLVDADHAAGLRAAAACGFRAVDVRLDFERSAEPEPAAPASAVRRGIPDDLRALAPLARGAFTRSRFFADGRFDPERCAAMFELWLAKGLDGLLPGFVLVDDAVRGFVVASAADGGGRIDLIAVAPEARGAGVGPALVEAAVRELGATPVRVATQGSAIGAQRLYQRCGFRTAAAGVWLHRWRDEAR